MSQVVIPCPACGCKLVVPPNGVGKRVGCPSCRGAFLIQAEAPARPSAAQRKAPPPPPPSPAFEEPPPPLVTAGRALAFGGVFAAGLALGLVPWLFRGEAKPPEPTPAPRTQAAAPATPAARPAATPARSTASAATERPAPPPAPSPRPPESPRPRPVQPDLSPPPAATDVVMTRNPKFARPVDALGEALKLDGDGVVTSVVFSSDSRFALSNFGKAVVLWDVESGKERARLVGAAETVARVAFAPGDREALSVGHNDRTVRRWDLRTGLEVGRFTVEGNTPVFSPDGRWVATLDQQYTPAGQKAVIKVWDALKGAKVNTLEGYGGPMAFFPDGRKVLVSKQVQQPTFAGGVSDSGKRSVVVDLATRKEEAVFPGHKGYQSFAVVSPRADRALLSTPAVLWDVQTGKEALALQAPPPYSTTPQPAQDPALAFSPDGRHALSGGASTSPAHAVRYWDLTAGKVVRTFQGHTNNVTCVAVAPNGRWGISGSYDRTLRLWDLQTGDELGILRPYAEWVEVWWTLKTRKYYLASGGEEATIHLCDAATHKVVRVFKGHRHKILCLALSADEKWLVTGDLDGVVRVWEVETGKEKACFTGHRGYVRTLAVTADGRRVATGGADKTVRLWDVSLGRELKRFYGHEELVTAVTFSADGTLIASGSKDRTARVWEAASGRERYRFLGHAEGVYSLSLSADGKCLLTASDDNTARVWEVATARELRSHPQSQVRGVAFSPDGQQYVVVPRWGYTGYVYSTQDGKQVYTGSTGVGGGTQTTWVTRVITTYTTVPGTPTYVPGTGGGGGGTRIIRVRRR